MVRKLCLAILRGDSLFSNTLILVAPIILVSACKPAKTGVSFTATFLPLSPTALPPTFTVIPAATP